MASGIDNLTSEQRDRVLRFLLHRMQLDTRIALMAEMPVVYARIHTSVDTDTILRNVQEGIAR